MTRPWTTEDLQHLRRRWAAMLHLPPKVRCERIAAELGRTESAIYDKATYLHLSTRWRRADRLAYHEEEQS